MKKIFAYLLTLVICFSFTNVLAEDVTVDAGFEKNVQKLSAFGVRVDGGAEDEVIRAEFIKKVLEFKSKDEINREILLKLIDKIVIENKKIKSISYNFSI